jgi:exopolysaccharide production protein ExoQ
MPSFQLVFQIIAGLGPYFSVAIFLAIVLGLFLPWGVINPQKWLYLYIIGLCLLPFGANDTDGSGSLYKQLTWALLYILCFVSLVRSRDNISTQKINIPIELILLYGFIFITIAWSDYKLSSFKRYILLIGLLLIAILSSKLSMLDKSFAKLVDKPLAFFMLLGLVVAVAWPRLAFDADGAFRAFTSHKNTWGQFMLLCSIVFFNNVLNRNNRLIYLPLLTISLGMLYMSKSATSLLAFISAAFCVLLIQGFSSKNIASKLIMLAIVLAASVSTLVYSVTQGDLPFASLIDFIYKATDKNTTLTGRTFLWQLMGAEIARHPWLGTGFGGFWVGLDGSAGTLSRRLDWGPPTQAHSGYIDVVNEVGFIGMTILAMVLILHIYRCCALHDADNRQHFSLHFSIVIGALFLNYAESSLTQGTNLWWIVLTCSIIEVFNRFHSLDPSRKTATGRQIASQPR